MKQELEVYLSLQEIADMAGVSKPAVANWRKRYSDFPLPVEGASGLRQPKFSYEEIRSWLLVNRKIDSKALAARESKNRVSRWLSVANTDLPRFDAQLLSYSILDLLNRGLSVEELKAETENVILLAQDAGMKHFNAEAWDNMRHALSEEKLSRIFEGAYELVKTAPSFSRLIEEVDAYWSRTPSRLGLSPHASSEKLTGLAGSLAAVQTPPVKMIYDPHIGGASTAAAAAQKSPSAQIFGVDISPKVLSIAETRLAAHDISSSLLVADIYTEDPFPLLEADFSFVQGPWGLRINQEELADSPKPYLISLENLPKSCRTEALTLMDTAFHLAAEGWGYVLTPLNLAMAGGLERFRNAFIAQGCVEAIIQLPGGLVQDTKIPLLLWVLRAPSQAKDLVTLVDASQAKNLVEEVSSVVQMLQHGEPVTGLPAQGVSLQEALSEPNFSWVPESVLRPEMTFEDVQERLDLYSKKVEEKQSSLALALEDYRETLDSSLESGAALVSLADLSSYQLPQAVLKREDILTDSADEGISVRLFDRQRGSSEPEEVRVSEDAAVLVAGDLVVRTAGKLRASAVPDDGEIYAVKGPTYVFRLDPSVWKAEYLAALINHQTVHAEAGSTLVRTRLQDIRIRHLSLAGQERIAQQLKKLADLRENTEDLTQALDGLMQSIADYSLSRG